MKPRVYYNDNEEYVCNWLANLMLAGLIPEGDIDQRSIRDVKPEDLRGYDQCHFFAGIGGWAFALQLAGWPEDREVWTGSCPCQPGSSVGKQLGFEDPRHLWPTWFELIGIRRPPTVFGEQVAAWTEWLRLVRSDMEGMGYAVGAIPIEAASAGADQLRNRFWFVADRSQQQQHRGGSAGTRGRFEYSDNGDLGSPQGQRRERRENDEDQGRWQFASGHSGARSGYDYYVGTDGKTRRVKSGIPLLAHGIPARVAKLRAIGNAIDPRPAAAFIKAFLACRP